QLTPSARLLLNSSPGAPSVTPSKRQMVPDILRSAFDVREMPTEGTGHATELAREAVREGVDLVAVLGGDGTVNEAVNGLAGTATPLAIVPGGGADVFARSLGIPKRPADAAARVTANWGPAQKERRVPLGRVVPAAGRPSPHSVASNRPAGRYFVANCGLGFDASIVRMVERKPQMKRRIGDWYFVLVGLRLFFLSGYDRRTPHVELQWGDAPDERRDGLFLAIVQNTSPYTYLGGRALRLFPEACVVVDRDCFTTETMRSRFILPFVVSTFGPAPKVDGP